MTDATTPPGLANQVAMHWVRFTREHLCANYTETTRDIGDRIGCVHALLVAWSNKLGGPLTHAGVVCVVSCTSATVWICALSIFSFGA